MSIYEELLKMEQEERKLWAKEYFNALNEAVEKTRGDPKKVQKLGEELAKHKDELISALIIATVKDEFVDDVLELRETLLTTLLGICIRTVLQYLSFIKR